MFDNFLDNFHTEENGDFSQVSKVKHSGALLIGTYDNFAFGEPVAFLKNINNHFAMPENNQLIFIEKTGHTYQQKEQETADKLLQLVKDWRTN